MSEKYSEELKKLVHDVVGTHSAIGMGISMLREGLKEGLLYEDMLSLIEDRVSLLNIKFSDLKKNLEESPFYTDRL